MSLDLWQEAGEPAEAMQAQRTLTERPEPARGFKCRLRGDGVNQPYSSPSPAARHTRLQSRHQPQYKKVELERIRRMTEQQESTSIISFQT